MNHHQQQQYQYCGGDISTIYHQQVGTMTSEECMPRLVDVAEENMMMAGGLDKVEEEGATVDWDGEAMNKVEGLLSSSSSPEEEKEEKMMNLPVSCSNEFDGGLDGADGDFEISSFLQLLASA
ncbi:OLC1v1016029C1 [Oldenlandia corymbosa var. corymbosa]|uniref:OLC1v1016029C1 n=1 Tax=Oldenlandia corymbosa var. corymbosa TaxID=529605 RepID=A0AAV1E4L7_OLDCO|nr:OLC1v1016029C1 [Oldenlandia corymbosa var. corymbosa]